MAASVTALGGILGSDGDANDVGTALLGAPGGPGSPRSTGGESSHSPSRRPRPPFDEITVSRVEQAWRRPLTHRERLRSAGRGPGRGGNCQGVPPWQLLEEAHHPH
jgi:hypothetical protein